MMGAYIRLHELGWAHSVETYEEGNLTGGLYGLGIGRMFYGESMFSRQQRRFEGCLRTPRSAIFLAHDYGMIDCQMRTEHLASLGGREIPRSDFLARLQRLTSTERPRECWSADDLDLNW
jgi:leucyl/phenylalanyl-tRNA--protein transferase